MKHFHHSKLRIENDIDNLPEAEACVHSVAELIGFSEHDNKQIQLALEEALTNIIKHSFAPGQLEDIDIEFTQVPLGLKISIWVRGIPFDPALFPIYKRKDLEENYIDRGLGTYLIRQVMDEYSYINHGHEGIEVILIKNLPSKSIEEMIGGSDEGFNEQKTREEKKPSFSIGLMKADEAVEVSRLAYYSYGYTYPYENLYFPDKVARLNQSGKLVSMVARLEDGRIIGHAALARETYDKKNAELGLGFTHPAYRGLGILNSLLNALIEKAKEEKIQAIYGMTVTTHIYSQKAAHHFGMNDCTLLVSKVPVLKFKNIEESDHPRESIMIAFRFLNPPSSVVVYPPKRHKTMIEKIFRNIKLNAEIRGPEYSIKDLTDRRSLLEVKTDAKFITATIQVDHCGKHTVKKVAEDLKQFCVERFETIYLRLNLNDPFSAILCPEFEKLGFFFAGIHPGDGSVSFLVLQYLNNQHVDYNLMDFDSDFGKQLANYVRKCDPNS